MVLWNSFNPLVIQCCIKKFLPIRNLNRYIYIWIITRIRNYDLLFLYLSYIMKIRDKMFQVTNTRLLTIILITNDNQT